MVILLPVSFDYLHMAHLEVFEGTWEELTTHAETFKGRQIRLIVLPVAAETTASITDELQLREAAASAVCRGRPHRARARHT